MTKPAGDEPRAESLRWNIGRRLEFVEFRLLWEGRINRADLMNQFGVSTNQASGDLSRYQMLAPDNMVYDKSAKHYRTSPGFQPLFYKGDASRYLTQLRLVADQVAELEETWLSDLPPYDVAVTPMRAVDTDVLRRLLVAVRERQALEVHYQSVGRPEAEWRWIEPHAFGFDGFRWHARAYCRRSQAFKDFVLARILAFGGHEPAVRDAEEDLGWSTWITLEIGPHPDLSPGQKAAIARDYGMEDQRLVLQVRHALLYYVRRRLGLDLTQGQRSAQEQQIVLLNWDAVQTALSRLADAE